MAGPSLDPAARQPAAIDRLLDLQDSASAREVASLILRAILASVFFAHGAQKLFGWFGGFGLDGTGAFFKSQGLSPGKFWALISGLVEFGGGLMIAAGLLTSLAALAVAGDMVIAIASVTGKHGWFTEVKGGFEINLMLIALALVLILIGPGRYSLDQALGLVSRHRSSER